MLASSSASAILQDRHYQEPRPRTFKLRKTTQAIEMCSRTLSPSTKADDDSHENDFQLEDVKMVGYSFYSEKIIKVAIT